TWRGGSRSGGSSCRGGRPSCRPGACSPPTSATRRCAPTSETRGRSERPSCGRGFPPRGGGGGGGRGPPSPRPRGGDGGGGRRAVDMRYGEQIFEVGVSLDGVDLDAPDVMKEIVERFHRRHEELYTYSTPDQEVVLVNARLAVVGELPALPEEPALPARNPAAPRSRRRVFLDGWHEVPVYDLDAVAPGQAVTRPAIVEAATTTAPLRARAPA